ncbi:MAG: hypothetical protein ACETWM_06490 [Candidatus Lokiarchaeia archaeon]
MDDKDEDIVKPIRDNEVEERMEPIPSGLGLVILYLWILIPVNIIVAFYLQSILGNPVSYILSIDKLLSFDLLTYLLFSLFYGFGLSFHLLVYTLLIILSAVAYQTTGVFILLLGILITPISIGILLFLATGLFRRRNWARKGVIAYLIVGVVILPFSSWILSIGYNVYILYFNIISVLVIVYLWKGVKQQFH